MKYIFQTGIILAISFAAELLHFFIPLPIPASVYGLVLLFALLCAKIIKPGQIEDVAGFLLGIMPILFIEPSVGLMTSAEAVKGHVLALVLMCLLSTAAVTVTAGLVAQTVIALRKKREKTQRKEREEEKQ